METIFKQNENALKHHYIPSDPIWTELGIQLDRNPQSIFEHWERFIKPYILLFENKIEDIRPDLIDCFVEKGIMFRSEINWDEVAKDKRFKGTTSAFLRYKLKEMVGTFKRANPGIERDDIIIEDVCQFLDDRGRKPIMDKRVSALIEDYVNIKNVM